MDPRLVALSGPHRGKVFALTNGELTCGRHPDSDLHLPAPTISRKHCVFRVAEGRATLVDLESAQGTFVNGLPVRQRVLGHGDQIVIGDSEFRFLEREEAVENVPAEFLPDDLGPAPPDAANMKSGDSIYLQPTLVLESLPEESRIARDLSALLTLSNAVNAIGDSKELQSRILEQILEMVPAERAAILLCSNDGPGFSAAQVRWRDSSKRGSAKPSLALARRVVKERSAFLTNAMAKHPSIADAGDEGVISSALCLPLEARGELLGVLYADSRDPSSDFTTDHLQLATAAASIAALALSNATRLEKVQAEARELRQGAHARIVGESAAIERLRGFIEQVGPKDVTVMILGETGTGKELFARALHDASDRREGPFVAINCGALTESLLESELFGHEKGAFTGASERRKGKLEAASGGTVFLDEVGEMSAALQVKLLRVLQEREIERVGGNRPVKVDIRILTATHRDLEAAAREGSFRSDLFFRLNVVKLDVPPLRDRPEDIALLANHFVAKHAEKLRGRAPGLSSEARRCLTAYSWPGNVRELENAIEHALVLGASEEIRPEDLPAHVLDSDAHPPASVGGFHSAVKEAKKQIVRKALDDAKDNFTAAARKLGVHPNYLHRLVNNLGLRDEIRKDRTPEG